MLLHRGVKKQHSTNGRGFSHFVKKIGGSKYVYPDTYSEFTEKQIEAYKKGVSYGKELFMKYCSKGYEYLIQTGDWDFLDNVKSVIPKHLHFSGHVSNEYALGKQKQIKSAGILANASVEWEEKLYNIFGEELEEFNANEETEQELQTQENNILDDSEESLIGKPKSGISADYLVDN